MQMFKIDIRITERELLALKGAHELLTLRGAGPRGSIEREDQLNVLRSLLLVARPDGDQNANMARC